MWLRSVLSRRLLLLLVLVPHLGLAQERDASSDPDAVPAMPVPVYVDGVYAGEIDAHIEAGDEVLVSSRAVVSLVQDVVVDRVLEDARTHFGDGKVVAPEAFAPLGISVSFDWDELLLRIAVPPLVRRPRRISLSRNRPDPQGTLVEPANFSVIANLDVWARYAYGHVPFEFAATPELATNVFGTALEIQGGVRSVDPSLFLDHVRVTRDLRELGYRVQGGDLTWRASELFDVGRVTGLSLFREGSLGDAASLADDVLQAIYLSESSEVTLSVNGSRRYERDHSPGNYEITNVPLGDGLNVVTIAWEDEKGPHELEIVVPHDGDLLEHGELDAGVAMGFADRDVQRPIVSAYQRYGVTPSLTVGLREGVEMLDFQMDAGAEVFLATRAGNFVLEPSVGLGPASRLLIDIPLRYYYLDSRPSRYLSFGLSGGYRSLASVDGSTTTDTITASGYVNFVFGDGFSFTPTVSDTFSLSDGTNQFTFRAALRKAIRGGSALSANVGLRYDDEVSLLATIAYSAAFPDAQQNLFVQQNLNSQELFAFWNRYPGESDQDLDFNVSAKLPMDTSEITNTSVRVGFNHPRFRASLGHWLAGVVATGELSNATTVSLQSGVVFADGVTALSTPVNDSFVAVVPEGALAETTLLVNRGGGRTDLSLLGTAGVLPGVSSYVPIEVAVTPDDMILGLDERALRYVVEPGYRSGTVIRVEAPHNIYAGGELLDENDDPLVHKLGAWSGPGETTGEFFTDGDGYFEMYGLRPGDYSLMIPGTAEPTFRVTIPEGSNEFVDLGEIVAEELQ